MRRSWRKLGGAMNAIDTNVVVRYLANDDRVQSAKARSLIDGGPVFVATTVLLEAEWVLRSGYGYSNETIAEAFGAFVGLPTVGLEEPRKIATALDRLAEGFDFADALHVAAAAGDCDAFLTFDRGLAKTAAAIGGIPVRAP